MKRISFIVPVFNTSAYLVRCLDSILNIAQIYGHEVIIVNDGSTDCSQNIIDIYLEKYDNIKSICQENAGLSAARNTGLKYATKEYVWFIDSDDYISIDSYEYLLGLLQKDYDVIIMGRMEEFKNRTKCVPKKMSYEVYNQGCLYFSQSIRSGNFRTNVWDKIIKRSLIETNHLCFVEGLLYEDMFFSLQMFMLAGKVVVSPMYFYHYDCSNFNSITKQTKLKDLDVLCFVELAEKFINTSKNILTTDSLEYNLLIFNWVSSCLWNKYSILSFTNETAKLILYQTLENQSFYKVVKYCARHNIGLRQFFSANVLLLSPYLYRIILSCALYIKKYWK